uniref:Uncharacterized protein n=1 Tax=Oryza sativa subsp. japonica TaxID=39947 RepID=Q6Z4A2_ORYSJ|nr:hypothetical protein [Oryza sativa Japonica Group]
MYGWPHSHATQVIGAAEGASEHDVTSSGSPAVSPRGPHPAAAWQRERAREERRQNSHKCATPQLSPTAFNAVRADVRRA